MDAIALHLEVRNALSLADELGRDEHALGNDELAGHLAALRSLVAEIERELGRSHAHPAIVSPTKIERLVRAVGYLRAHRLEVPPSRRPRADVLVAALERVAFAESRPSEAVPAKSVLGRLPLARLVPQDVHSVVDWVAAAGYLASARLATTTRGRLVGLALAAKVGGVAAISDVRLSRLRMLPVELHEGFDLVAGASAVAAPLVLGYVRRDPVAALVQMGVGVGSLLASLLTDYRATRGVGRPIRANGGAARRRAGRSSPLAALAAPAASPRVVRRAKADPPLVSAAKASGSEPARARVAEPARVAETARVADTAIVKNLPTPRRVPEVQRPLEGLAGPSALPSLEDLEVWGAASSEDPLSRS